MLNQILSQVLLFFFVLLLVRIVMGALPWLAGRGR